MLISVIMPVYNCEKYLEAAVNSVLDQECDLEIIAVDDFSADSSRQILSSLAKKDSRIKPVFNTENIGVAAVRNKALKLAAGDYLAFCDSDDIVPPGAYKALISSADGVDFVIGAHSDRYDSGKLDPVCFVKPEDRSSAFRSLFTVSCLWTKLIKKSFVLDNELSFDEDMTIGEDVVFLAKAAVKNPTFSVINDTVYYHCQHDSAKSRSLTHIYTFRAFEKHIECRERVLEICKEIDGVEDFLCINFSQFIIDFILIMPDGDELDRAFSLFKEHLLLYGKLQRDHVFFKALLGIEYEEFIGSSAEEYRESVRALPSREKVLYEYEAGRIGFSWIIKYAKAWLKFKLKRKNK